MQNELLPSPISKSPLISWGEDFEASKLVPEVSPLRVICTARLSGGVCPLVRGKRKKAQTARSQRGSPAATFTQEAIKVRLAADQAGNLETAVWETNGGN